MKDNIVVTTYKDPDLDGYACVIGYAELLNKQNKNVQAVILGRPLLEVDFVVNYTKSKIFTSLNEKLKNFDQIILVDKSIVDNRHDSFDKDKVIEVIDHRKVHESYLFSQAKIQIELVGSCATLTTEKFLKAKIEPEIPTAFFLYGAICSNTINLKNKVTTSRDIQAAKYLKDLAKIPDDFIEQMFAYKSDLVGEKLIVQMKNDALDSFKIGDKKFDIFQIESIDCENLIRNRIVEIEEFISKDAKEKKVDYFFINLIDIYKYYTTIISPDKETKELLRNALSINFQDNVAKTDYIIMRKEIVAKIKDHFKLK